MMERPYEVVQSKSNTFGRFVVIQDILCINGREYPFSYLNEGQCVCVMVIYHEEIILLRQYRHAINEWKIEFPCGGIDAGESPENAARREVLEETGCVIERLIPLGNQYMRPGVSNGKVHFFLGFCNERKSMDTEPTELIETLSVTLRTLDTFIENGEFEQMLGIICFHKSQPHLKNYAD